jgi:hypothetical protein
MRRIRYLTLALLVLCPMPAAAEWHIKPFLGVTFGGQTTFVDVEKAAGKPNRVLGVSGVRLGNVLGVDADLGQASGFFESGSQSLLQQGSRVTTLTGNAVVALPKRMAGYALRPYFVGGMGLMHIKIDGRLGALNVSRTLPAMDLGGGVTGFLNDRIGLSWEVRHFRSFNGDTHGFSFGDERLSFWRANMALAIRYGK